MFGFFVTVVFALVCAGAGWGLLSKFTKDLDPAERIGFSGLVGLAATGVLTLLIGVSPIGLQNGVYFVLIPAVAGLYFAWKGGVLEDLKFKRPEGLSLALLAGFILFLLIALIGVLSPSTSMDWDSLAYHLAVPKLWLQRNQIGFVEGIHHSNFPFSIDCLYIWGLMWGGEPGAKAFSWTIFLFGGFAVFGLVRRLGGPVPAWWSLLGFAAIPVVAWESGTAYIDVAHGLFAALAFIYSAAALVNQESRKSFIILAGVAAGFALGTKLTGLQTILSIGLVLTVGGFVIKQGMTGLKTAVAVCAIGLAIASPWLIKTTIYTGNPTYPFLYSIFKGKDWDDWRAKIYTREQQSFGVGRSEKGLDPLQMGYGVMGLAMQPGRFVNPGQQTGQGFPTGAIGFACLIAGFLLAISGRANREQKLTLAMVGLGFLMWYFLSQQSRYLTSLALPLLIIGFAAYDKLKLKQILPAAVVLQSLATLYLLREMQLMDQLQVVTGKVTPQEYRAKSVGLARWTETLNALPPTTKIALYDEVFGFLLDREYMWANPGHSTFIPYDKMNSGEDYAREMKALGFSHVYVNLQFTEREAAKKWIEAMSPTGTAFTEEEKTKMIADLDIKWRWLIADAARNLKIQIVDQKGPGLLFEIQP